MTTRVAVVTGASSGLGKATAQALAAQGFRVIGTGRDPDRCAVAEAELRALPGQRGVDFLRADLSRLTEAARLAREIAALTDRIDVLVDNAGGMAREPAITEEGLEENFAANHLGPFLLTQRLLPLLRAAAADAPPGSVRIVVTASDASEMIPGLDFDDLQSRTEWNPGKSYCRAKLANVLFARGLARRLASDGIVAHAMHPGYVESNFITHAPEQSQNYMRTLTPRTPEQGADTLIWLATAPEPGETSGGYWSDRAPRTANPVVDDAAYVDRLWTESEKLVAQVAA